jgi:hypothetical protein
VISGNPTRQLDLSGLGGGVSLREVRTFDRAYATPHGRRWWVTALIVAVYLVGQMVLLAVLLPIAIWDERMLRSILAVIALLTGAYATFLMALLWRRTARTVRIERTARANGFEYSDREPRVRFAGSALQRTGRLEASDVLRSDPAAPVDFAIGTFAAGTGLLARRAGVAEIRLEREVPHIVLENQRARILRRTGDRFRRQQRLHLEGDFDRTFALYCPAGYERDALYIFTPDLMALLLDLAPDCEVELIGDRFVLYAGRPWRLWIPDRFARVVSLVEAVGRKATRQTSAYRDERADAGAPASVATGGRRLRTRPSLGTVLSLAFPALLAAWGLVQLLPFPGR